MSLADHQSHFLDLADLPDGKLRHLLNSAHKRKAARAGKPKGTLDDDAPLAGHLLAMIFEKPSTRTRLSFDMGMRAVFGFVKDHRSCAINHLRCDLTAAIGR